MVRKNSGNVMAKHIFLELHVKKNVLKIDYLLGDNVLLWIKLGYVVINTNSLKSLATLVVQKIIFSGMKSV